MPQLPSGGSAAPTPYSDLNAVLADLVEGQKRVLGDNLIGVYLQGSFAAGDADENSDVDWTAVVRRDLNAEEVAGLAALHASIFDRGATWSTRLEGSYAPIEVFRRLTAEPRDPPGEPRASTWADPGTSGSPPKHYPFWYLGNAHREMVRSEHDNTQVLRWVTREHGIALFGPPAADLIDPVSPDALRGEVRALLRRIVAEWTGSPAKMNQRFLQTFFVTLTARMLHSLQTGEIRSKKAATEWAVAHLEPRWTPLIESAFAARTQALEVNMAPADRAAVAETLAFMRYALRFDARLTEQRLKAERSGAHDPLRGQHRAPPPKFGGPHMARGAGPAPIRPGGRGRRG
jgi:hypothetical protein